MDDQIDLPGGPAWTYDPEAQSGYLALNVGHTCDRPTVTTADFAGLLIDFCRGCGAKLGVEVQQGDL